MRYLLGFLLFFSVCLAVTLTLSSEQAPVRSEITLQQALSDESGSFASVEPGRTFSFPADHGPHREYKTEWWYFTGNLNGPDEEHFGYQLTLFRVGRALPGQTDNPSEWSSQSLYMGHLGLSDSAEEKFYCDERLSREGVGLAGALDDGRRIWLEDWEIRREDNGWRLSAQSDDVSLDLTLQDTKPPVLQGDGGYSRKGPQERHASYYVSQTRLATTGKIRAGSRHFDVNGTSWFDHEWSSEAMAEGLVGWDWFSLQLSDQTELMIYLLRYEDGRLEPASSGAFVRADGSKTELSLEQFEVEALATVEVASGISYPARWKIEVPTEKLSIVVEPTLADQEMTGRVPYWEGAVTVEGQQGDSPISGRGFVELTGYSNDR